MSLTLDLLERPTLALEVEKYRAYLAEEAKVRDAFRDRIEPHEKGEFINGIIFMHSPARDAHNVNRSLIERLLTTAIDAGKISGRAASEKAMCAFTRNDYEPDVVWFAPAKAAQIGPATTLYPVPDFIVEILSPATAQRDRGVKFDDYAAHGVREYWIVDADARTVEQYELDTDNNYQLIEKLAHAEIRPVSFPGLSIPVAAFFEPATNLSFLKSLL